MDIYQALKKDHDELKPVLDQLVAASEVNASTQGLLGRISDMLIPHSRAEEAVFYQALRNLDATKHLVDHRFAEHAEAETLLRTLQGVQAFGIEWTNVAKKLRAALLHHITDEEGRIFAGARLAFFDDEARQMAQAFEQAKQRARTQGDLKNIGDFVANMLAKRSRRDAKAAPQP